MRLKLLGLDDDLYAVMRVPSREIKVYIPVRMDTGHIQVLRAIVFSTISHAARQRAVFDMRPTFRLTR